MQISARIPNLPEKNICKQHLCQEVTVSPFGIAIIGELDWLGSSKASKISWIGLLTGALLEHRSTELLSIMRTASNSWARRFLFRLLRCLRDGKYDDGALPLAPVDVGEDPIPASTLSGAVRGSIFCHNSRFNLDCHRSCGLLYQMHSISSFPLHRGSARLILI